MRRLVPALIGAGALAAALLSAPAHAGKANDTLTWATDRDAETILPYYNPIREVVIMGTLGWDTLLYRNDKFEYEPLLAKSYKWVDDVTMEFVLREDVKFHNGKQFKAEDVAYTVNHVVHKDSGTTTRNNVAWMKSAEVVSDFVVRIHLEKPFPAALEYLSGPVVIYPKGNFDNAKDVGGKKDYGTSPAVGTGPYIVTEQKPGERFVFKANPNYFGGPKGKPRIGTIVFRVIPDPEAQIAELLTGGVDWLWDVPKDKAEQIGAMGPLTVVSAPTMRISYIQFNTAARPPCSKDPCAANGDGGTKSPFMNKKVREAFAHAVNRESIAKNLVGGASEVMHSACYPTQFGCTDDVKKWSYDPAKAKALLAEAGYPGGFETDIYAYRQREYTEAVIGDLAQVGIKANLKFMQFKALRELVWKASTPVNQMTWGSFSINDVSAILGVFFANGRDDLNMDPELAAWLNKGDTTVDPAVRKENYKKALQKISAELYWLPMFSYAKYYAFTKDLNFKPTPDEIPQFYNASWK
jgi:peptide/nickel transport system substrate-binding protein